MKKISFYIPCLLLGILTLTLSSCLNSCTHLPPPKPVKPVPLNISVYLDLSDRLTKGTPENQMERDTALINYLVDLFIEDCIKNGKIINSENHFQIFFYPTPKNSNIAQLAQGLNVDMASTKPEQKRVELNEIKKRFQTNLTQIYSSAIKEGKWIGSDIWGFFSNKDVDNLCIRKGYRNILVILTDGYLYHSDNLIKDGSAYSYISSQTLQDPNSSLIVKRKGLDNLEVLMLELNPSNLKETEQMINTLEKWFNNMGVNKFVVSKTDVPANTKTYIKNFFQN